jgi:hypothetical protein
MATAPGSDPFHTFNEGQTIVHFRMALMMSSRSCSFHCGISRLISGRAYVGIGLISSGKLYVEVCDQMLIAVFSRGGGG